MRITNQKLILKVPSNKYLPSIQEEIRSNLSRMGVNGISIDIRYDARTNVALVRFSFNSKNYEMSVSNQKDVRANLWAINKRIEYKARMHLLNIEPFEVSVSPYLQLENKSNYQEAAMVKASAHAYAVLGVPEYSSNDEIKKKYQKLCKMYHPDMSLSSEGKEEFTKKIAEINEAYTEISKERGL